VSHPERREGSAVCHPERREGSAVCHPERSEGSAVSHPERREGSAVCHPERREGSAFGCTSRSLVASLLGMTRASLLGMTPASLLGMTRASLLGMICLPIAISAQTVDTTVTIKASSSTLEFDPPNLALKQGLRVRLRLVNAGTLPHNVVIVKNEDDIDALAMAAMQEGGDYVPGGMKDKLFAYTTLASPGQTVDVTFVVPKAGAYTYVCLMSGHSAMMLGTLRSLR
jgi:plastocyanin